MKALAAACFLTASAALGQQVVIYQPQPPVTVVSPLTPAPAATNQTLLNQINTTITQRRTEHDILTSNATLRAQTPVVTRPR